MGYFTAQLISAVKLGSIYALVAIGYSIVYSIMGMINFAHGELLMIATFSLWVLLNAGIPFAGAVALAIVITALFGILIERIAYRSIRNAGARQSSIPAAKRLSFRTSSHGPSGFSTRPYP